MCTLHLEFSHFHENMDGDSSLISEMECLVPTPIYTWNRCGDALCVVKKCIAAEKKRQDELIARFHYRDAIGTRSGGQKNKKYLDYSHPDDDDEDDGEFDPCGEETPSKKPNKKNIIPSGPRSTFQADRSDPKCKTLSDSDYQPFLSLKLSSSESKQRLDELSREHQTDVNVYIRTHSTSVISNSGFEASGGDLSSEDEQQHRLRSGKILETWQPKKRPTSPVVNKPIQENTASPAPSPVPASKEDTPSPALTPKKDQEVRISTKRPRSISEVSSVIEVFPKSNKRARLETNLHEALENGAAEPIVNRLLNEIESIRPIDEQFTITYSTLDGTPIRPGSTKQSAINIESDEEDAYVAPGPSRPRVAISPEPMSIADSDDDTVSRLPGRPSPDPQTKHVSDEFKVIRTRFAHPMNLQSQERCDFCDDHRYGIMGLSRNPVTVSVAYNPRNPTHYIEMNSLGHSARHPSSHMCPICAIHRCQIVNCETHTFVPIPTLSDQSPQAKLIRETDHARTLNDWFKVLHDKTSKQRPKPAIQATCSFCIGLASWTCNKYQTRNDLGQPCFVPGPDNVRRMQKLIDDGVKLAAPVRGCGLLACDGCKVTIERNGGRLDQWALEQGVERVGTGRLRADREFLFRDGMVWQVYHGSG